MLDDLKTRYRSWKFRRLRRKVEHNIRRAHKGRFKYDGLFMCAKVSGKPLGYVRYSEGYCSAVMALGNAVEYASMFDGKVVHAHNKS